MPGRFSKYIRFLKNLLLILLVVFIISRCQLKQNGEVNRTASWIVLEEKWGALADSKGEMNMQTDSAVVESAEFSPNEKYIATGSNLGKELIVWDAKTGDKLFEEKYPEKLEIVLFSPDGKLLLAGGEFQFLKIYTVGSWTEHKKVIIPSGIEGMAFSNDGEILALGREDGIIQLLDPELFEVSDSLIHGIHGVNNIGDDPHFRADVNSIDFSPDDRYLVSGGFDGDIKIWYLPKRRLIQTIRAHESSIKSVRINNKGNCIASASSGIPYEGDNSIKIWDFNSGNLLHQLTSPMGMEAVEFTPSGEFLLGGAREFHENRKDTSLQGYIYVYYIPTNFLNEPISLVKKEPVFLSEYFDFNIDGSQMVSGHQDGSVRVWDVIYKK